MQKTKSGRAHTAIIFGASGFLGSNLQQRLTALAIPSIPVSRRRLGRERNVAASGFDLGELKTKIRSLSADTKFSIFNLVGSGSEHPLRPILESNLTLTNQIIEFARQISANIFVHVAGFGIPYGSFRSTETYYSSKGAAIELVLASGINSVILNPSYIVGRDDEFSGLVEAAIGRGEFIIPSLEELYIQPIFVGDFVEILVTANEYKGESTVINVLGEKIEIAEFFSRIFTARRAKVKITRVSLETAMRSAVFEAYPPFSVSALCVLIANRLGDYSPKVFDVMVRPIDEFIGSL